MDKLSLMAKNNVFSSTMINNGLLECLKNTLENASNEGSTNDILKIISI